jgi:hypothetical protein
MCGVIVFAACVGPGAREDVSGPSFSFAPSFMCINDFCVWCVLYLGSLIYVGISQHGSTSMYTPFSNQCLSCCSCNQTHACLYVNTTPILVSQMCRVSQRESMGSCHAGERQPACRRNTASTHNCVTTHANVAHSD